MRGIKARNTYYWFKVKREQNNKSNITKTSIRLNVKFETFQIRALLDKNDEIIDGDNNNEILVKDEWIFEKNKRW